MSTLGVWSMLAIFYQTFLSIVISWLILYCKLPPDAEELAEVTLAKLLYLYEPEACGRRFFYNYSTEDDVDGAWTAVVWPVRNHVAARFRTQVQVWLALHLVWAVMAIVNVTQGSRPCGYYVTLLPLTLAGMALLVVDLVFCALFLLDAQATGTEPDILAYINSNKENLQSINTTLHRPADAEDTSWIAVILAYCSLRGIVQWVINFWIVKDSYFNGLNVYHRLQLINVKGRSRAKSIQITRNPV